MISPLLVLDHAGALDEIGVAQAHFAAGREAEEFLGRIFAEILLLDVEHLGEGHFARAGGGVFGIVDGVHLFGLVFGIVVDDHLERAQDGHDAGRAFVEVFADEVFQAAEFDGAVGLGEADGGAEVAHGFGRVAAAPDAGERGHARIVPAAHAAFLHEGEELALAEQGVGEVEAVEFDLLRMIDAEGLDVPIVERAVIFEFQGADGVGDAFDGIALPVGVVVHGIDAPFVAGAVMFGVQDAVHDGIAQVEIGRRHVDFGAEGAAAVGELAGLHAGEEVEIFFDGAIAVGAFFAGLGEACRDTRGSARRSGRRRRPCRL